MEVVRKGGAKFASCEFYWVKGRVDLMDENKKELANMQTESAYTKAIKIYWAPRGGSYYVTFNKPLFDQPRDRRYGYEAGPLPNPLLIAHMSPFSAFRITATGDGRR